MAETLESLSNLAKALGRKRLELAEKEQELKEIQEQIKRLDEILIPEAMQSLGLTEIKLDSGAKISYTRVYYANISEERMPAAEEWLKKNKFDSILKTNVGLVFGAGLEDKVDHALLKKFLDEHEIEHKEKKAVHPQTLKAFVRERLEAETDTVSNIAPEAKLPRELFGVHEAFKTVVEEPKTTNKQTK
jgi:hypothetical protein